MLQYYNTTMLQSYNIEGKSIEGKSVERKSGGKCCILQCYNLERKKGSFSDYQLPTTNYQLSTIL